MGLINKFVDAVKRLNHRFDFSAHKEEEARSQRAKKGKRPPKRKHRK